MNKLLILIFLISSSITVLADNSPCYLEVGDGTAPKNIEHSVQFRGPNNGFWNYLSEDPATWIFEIVSAKNPKVKKTSFESIAIRRPDGVFVRFEKDIQYLPNNRFTFTPSKIAQFVDESSKALKSLRKANPNSFPPATKYVLQVMFTFQSNSDGSSDEDWLNHTCNLGFGLNSLSGRLSAKDGKQALSKFAFTIHVNNPSLDSSGLKDKIAVQTDSNGAFLLKGLPMGTLIADLPTPNKQAAIAYFDDLPKKCDWEIKKEASKEAGWTVSKTDCSSLSGRGL